jgi:anti-sigma B factor antagonist
VLSQDMPNGDVALQGSQPGFEVQTSVRDGRHTLLLSGELDLAVAAGLEATVLDLCGEGVSAIELELSKLTFMDSTGLRAVLRTQELCAEHGCDFLVIPGGGQVQRLLELTGTAEVLPLADAPASPSAEADRLAAPDQP